MKPSLQTAAKSYFGKHSYNHSIMILSDMPQTQKGSWFLHYRDKMDVELIKTIEATVYEIWRTKERIRAINTSEKPVPPYFKGYLRRLDRDLNKMRSAITAKTNPARIENRRIPINPTKIRQTCRVQSYRLAARVATRRKNTSSNTTPTAPMLSIPSTSTARNPPTATLSPCQCQA